MSIQPCELPPEALLQPYRIGQAYTDCYCIEVMPAVSHARYVEAFYTTAVFKAERWLLRWLASRPSTDLQARQLAAGERDTFAAWRVEARTANQILMCDMTGRTRSWLMVADPGPGPHATRLYFGSAVVLARDKTNGPPKPGFLFHSLLGFHKVYSRVLLAAARRRLTRG